jgi:shikimate 5-dehydrogenase
MLLAQGAAAIKRWFPKQTPPIDVMRAALHAALD